MFGEPGSSGATEVRIVFSAGFEAVSNLEFNTTTSPVQVAKVTITNGGERGYKVADAVRLLGE